MITVEQVLANNNIHFKSSETKFSIRCLSPEHEDRHPSMAVNKTTGDAQCFSCGYTTNVYKLFGIQISQANTKVQERLLADKPEHLIPHFGDYSVEQDQVFGIRREIPAYKANRGECYNLKITQSTLS